MFFAGYLTGFLALALSALPGATAYADPGACSGDCWAHDPCLIKRSDGTYFRFNTGSEIGIWTADAISMFRSITQDMIQWIDIFHRPDLVESRRNRLDMIPPLHQKHLAFLFLRSKY